ncbi:MAG: metal-dependent transcriptional regulator [Nitriliruptorales bacterium]
MYVRTVWELEEEGIVPIRARLAERLGLSAPSVSETVSRLENEGLLGLSDDRVLELTEEGRALAVSVMRKHRLAECLLVDVIGLEWERVHEEACRWEHVISDQVESKLVELLGEPKRCPHGNPIPGLGDEGRTEALGNLAAAAELGAPVRIERLSEKLQGDIDAMRTLVGQGLMPGTVVEPKRRGDRFVMVVDGREVSLRVDVARLVYVAPAA